MGAGASALTLPSTLPEQIDKQTAQSVTGDKFDQVAFDNAANDGVLTRVEFLRAVGVSIPADTPSARHLVDMPEKAMLAIFRCLGSPLLPTSSLAFVNCCKTLRAMPSLKRSSTAFKKPHKDALVFSRKVGTTLERIGSVLCARVQWDNKGLKPADVKLFVGSVACHMPKLCELDLRANALGDAGLKHLIDASAKGHLPKLYCLAISNNKITSSGVSTLTAAALAVPPTFLCMQTLMLKQNEIDAGGMASLASALADGALPCLLTLYTKVNPGDDEAVQLVLTEPSEKRVAAAKAAGGNAWEYAAPMF